MGGKLLGLGVVAALALLAGCGGGGSSEAGPPPKTADEVAADPVKARELAYEAERTLKKAEKGKATFADARAQLRQAEPYADVDVRGEIREISDRIDREEAKSLTGEPIAAAKAGKCGPALDATAALVTAEGHNDVFRGYVHQQTREANVGCLIALVEAGKLRDARLLAETKSAQDALGEKAFGEFRGKLSAAVGAALTKVVQPLLDAKKWPEVVAELRKAIDAGDAGSADAAATLELVTKGVGAELKELAAKPALTAKGSDPIKRFDELSAVVFAPKDQPAAAKGAKGLVLPPMPQEIVDLRAELAFAVVCAKLKCAESASKKVWAYGNTSLLPTNDPKGAAVKPIPHGRYVWQIATAPGIVLVSETDPGKLETMGARARPAAGWVPAKDLREQDTTEMLPPGDSIVGVRVWGPLRDKESNLELGTVVAVETGGNVKVRRMSDRQEVSIARTRLAFGAIKKGMKVLAMCGKGFKLQPALIDTLLRDTKFEAQGDPLAKLNCVDEAGKPTGENREELMGAVRMAPGDLPKGL